MTPSSDRKVPDLTDEEAADLASAVIVRAQDQGYNDAIDDLVQAYFEFGLTQKFIDVLLHARRKCSSSEKH